MPTPAPPPTIPAASAVSAVSAVSAASAVSAVSAAAAAAAASAAAAVRANVVPGAAVRPASQTASQGGAGRADVAVAAGLVLLALLWRLPGLGATPGWDGDEGYNLDIAWHLLHFRAQSFALDYAFVQHPVLYYALLAPVLALTGPQIWAARALAAVAAALGVGALYLAVAHSGRRRAALLGALSLAGAHFAVAHTRLAFTYNLLLLWTALTLLAVTRWETTRRPLHFRLAVACAALGLLTDQVGVALPLFVALRAWPHRRLAGAALLGGAGPAVLAALVMVAITPESALADWRHTLSRVGGGDGPPAPAGAALARWALNYLHLLRAEWWWPAAVAGLFCVRPLADRRRALALAGLLALPIFALRELVPAFRTGIPLLVPGALGLGALLDAGMRAAYDTTAPRRLPGAVLAALVVLLPLGLEIGRSVGGLATGFGLPVDWALVQPPAQAHAREAAAYVNARTGRDSVVVTSPHVAWLYRARVADFLQATAAGGARVAFYPAALPVARFRFDPSPQGADVAVVDAYWDAWAQESAEVAGLRARFEAWPLAWSAGDVRVHLRPAPPG